MGKGIGIDLGGANLRVCLADRGVVIHEPSLAAVAKDSERILKFGAAAEAFLKESPKEANAVRPFRGGVVNRCDTAQKVLAWCRKRCFGQAPTTTARTLISVPCCLTEVEQSAMIEVAIQAGFEESYLVYAPLAALYGSGMNAGGSALVVTVGATKTDILAVHHGKCVHIDSVDAAGDMFDDAIVSYIQRKYHVRLSTRNAEIVKKRLGTVWCEKNTPSQRIDLGLKDSYGNQKTITVTSEEMFTILEEPTAALMEAIHHAIYCLPSESVKDIFDTGILLTGGMASLDGLDKMISGLMGMRCRKVDAPEDAVIRGMQILLEQAPSSIRNGCINFAEFLLKN
jgi:rod shape-determining protein MreB